MQTYELRIGRGISDVDLTVGLWFAPTWQLIEYQTAEPHSLETKINEILKEYGLIFAPGAKWNDCAEVSWIVCVLDND